MTERSSAKTFFRILDANFNRAKEALRVGEDFSRFLLNDKTLTYEFKKKRHDITRILLKFPTGYKKLLMSRDALPDVGRHEILKDKSGHLSWQDIFCANLKRGQEAVRVLEEISKAVSPKQSTHLQKLRFELYDLEKRVFKKF